jgi:hypothetical protein
MNATFVKTGLVVLAVMLASPAFGQAPYTLGGPIYSPPMYYDHASTWEEGVMRGRAEMMRGFGEMTYNNTLAAINAQEAYSHYLDNRLKAVTTYFDLRKLNREARAEERGQRATPEKLAEIAKIRAPDRLAAYHFDAATHQLVWPAVLEDPYFAAERESINRLMEARRGVGLESREIQLVAETMTEKLRTQIHGMKPNDYIAAKRFLTSLEYEMNFAPATTAVAVR